MRLHKLFVFSVLVLALALGACAPAASDNSNMSQATEAMPAEATEVIMDKPTEAMMGEATNEMMDKPTEAMMDGSATPDAVMHGTGTPEAMMGEATEAMMETEVPGTMMDTAAWLETELTNVTTGETFKLSDYQGKVVLVELMAQWCPTCLRQQQEVVKLREKLGMDSEVVIVALDIDLNEDAETLKAYAAQNGFDWSYAVAPAEVAREIGNLYGAQFLNPPSAPMLLIDRSGKVHPLPFGVKSADELYEAIQPLLKEGM